MRVVIDGFIYQHQARGGISRLFSELLPRMCSIDPALDVELLTNGRLRQALPEHPQISHRRVLPVEALLRPYRWWWRLMPRVRALAQRSALGPARGRLWHSTYYSLIAGWEGRQVLTVQDMIYELYPDLFSAPGDVAFRKWKARCVAAADALICPSRSTARDLERICGPLGSPLQVVYYAASPCFRPLPADERRAPVEEGRPFFLYVGDRTHYKNFDGLIRHFATWHHRDDVDLAVVGPPWTLAESRQLAESGVIDRVRWLGRLDDEELCRLYNRAAALVYPSVYEGFGIPLVEAMVCGCPIVASRIPSTVEVAEDCPAYFDPAEAESLHRSFDAVLGEGRGSPRTIRGLEIGRRYSWDRAARETLAVYRSLID